MVGQEEEKERMVGQVEDNRVGRCGHKGRRGYCQDKKIDRGEENGRTGSYVEGGKEWLHEVCPGSFSRNRKITLLPPTQEQEKIQNGSTDVLTNFTLPTHICEHTAVPEVYKHTDDTFYQEESLCSGLHNTPLATHNANPPATIPVQYTCLPPKLQLACQHHPLDPNS